jgi:hypothetical protein
VSGTEVKPDCFGEYPLNASQYAAKGCQDCPFEDDCYNEKAREFAPKEHP